MSDEHEDLGQRIIDLMSDLDKDDQMRIALNVVFSILSGTRCPECRRVQADMVRMVMPDLIKNAMAAPNEREHLH